MVYRTGKDVLPLMSGIFAEKLKRLRAQRQLSQQTLSEMLFVDRSTVASWETGRRLPDAAMLTRIAGFFGVETGELLSAVADKSPLRVILVDAEEAALRENAAVVREALPEAETTGYLNAVEALEFARQHRVDLAIVDVVIGQESGMDLCRALLAINPRANVVFLTAHADRSLAAWETGASAFLLKPLTRKDLAKALALLRHPIPTGGA